MNAPATSPGIDAPSFRLTGTPLSTRPVGPGDRLVIMGGSSEVTAAITHCAQDACALVMPDLSVHGRRRVAAHLRSELGLGKADLAAGTRTATLARRSGLALDHLARTRLRDLTADQTLALRLTLALGRLTRPGDHSHTLQPTTLVLDDPFSGLSAGARTSARRTVLATLDEYGLGLVLATTHVQDAALFGGDLVVLEMDQVAQRGPLAEHLAEPRSNLAAGFTGVNVFSGLARGGWLSIGHSQVRARTELDGKVYVTIPTAAATLSRDEFDPVFSEGATVFEAVVVAVREKGDLLQLTLSPADTEVGLALSVDWLDFRPATMATDPVLHPALGVEAPTQLMGVTVGTRLWVEVDTTRMHAYSVEDPTD
ncbi:hypothetical protein [Brevibacterium litoralis]|uniref:hypothetical protein n=1 Tax=Brevibacterium litoralis TaxID=3138935 RepID=UPI0032EC64D7